MVFHEQPSVVRKVVIVQFELAANRNNSALPPDTLTDKTRCQTRSSCTYGFESKTLE